MISRLMKLYDPCHSERSEESVTSSLKENLPVSVILSKTKNPSQGRFSK